MEYMDYLIVVDMQNDFITGSLGSADTQATVSVIKEKLDNLDKDTIVVFTQDTHKDDYLQTHEGQYLPVPHCIKGTEGWEIVPELQEYSNKGNTVEKVSFGTTFWERSSIQDGDSIELCGVCTDICVVSNALVLRAAFPNSEIIVDSKACAGTSPEAHEAALKVMESCHIKVIR